MKYHKIKIPTLATPTEIGFEQPTSTDTAVILILISQLQNTSDYN